MNRSQWKKLDIDTRTAADIEKRISELAGLYDTGWHFDADKPDIGTALAKVFASEMEENISRVNDILDRYHTEFVNMLDISLLPAKPSAGFVVMQMISDTVDGTGVPKGTKLLASTGGETDIVFETDHSLYVTSSTIVDAFMTDGEEGTFTPLLGTYTAPRVFGDGGLTMSEDGEQVVLGDAYSAGDVIKCPELKPFTLFGKMDGIGRDALIFYHRFLFNVGEDEIFVRFEDADELIREIKEGLYVFNYVCSDGLVPIDHVAVMPDNETFILQKDRPTFQVPVGTDKTALIALVATDKVTSSRKTGGVTFSAKGEFSAFDSVADDNSDLDVNRFLPFSDTLSVYNECFIGHDNYFSKRGARITITFELSFEENRIALRIPVVDNSLKIIKRRPQNIEDEVYVDAFVDDIVIEYFNGIGWKRLELDDDYTNVFKEEKARKVTMSFICPEDWVETSSGAYTGKTLRLQVTRSDNCYMRPAVHHYPVIENMRVSYTYEDRYLEAEKMEMISGTRRFDLTHKRISREGLTVFSVSEYKEDALYLGFSKKIEHGPVSILFDLEEGVRYNGVPFIVEYTGPEGSFRRMKILDYTDDFTKTGIIGFVPPADWVTGELEGKKHYWLRFKRSKKESQYEDTSVLPRISSIVMNSVQISNIETREEEDAYIDEVVPNMRFNISVSGILDAKIWVNEMGRYSQDQMRQMKNDSPDSIRIEEDAIGTITAFFVLWHETDRLETSTDPRVYLLDRLTNELIFGDGITTWIPRVLDNVALKYSIRCCNGAEGNVEANTIREPEGRLSFIGDITNPNKSYGGSNIESIDTALERGASILSSRKRLVTMGDYLRAISAYSDTIDQVAGIVGETVEGEIDDSSMTFLLLMKEFAEGSFAFHRVVGGLKNHLLEQNELTVTADQLHLIEPIFVDISVGVWVTLVKLDDSFEIQDMLTECLEEYLNPIGYEKGTGWKIGNIPKKHQILMRLGILKSRAIVRKSVMIATYTDHDGYHEVDLEDLKVTPFMVCRSGKHEVHIIY